jgi:predicted Zn-dependent protease
VNTLLNRPELPAEIILQLAQVYADLKQFDRVTEVLTLFTQRYPQNYMGWYNLAVVYSARSDCASAGVALQRALAVDSPDGMVRNTAATDQRFANCRSSPDFQRALGLPPPPVAPGQFRLER